MCVSIGYFTICGKITKNRAQRKKKSFFFLCRGLRIFTENVFIVCFVIVKNDYRPF